MITMAPARPTQLPRATELRAFRVRLAAGPAAAAEARRRVRSAIRVWGTPVDPDVAVLLTSDLVTYAIRHETGGTITLGIRHGRGQLWVDAHGTRCSWPVAADALAGPRIEPGLSLVARLSAEWGFYHTPTGTVVYFTLPAQPHLAGGGGHG